MLAKILIVDDQVELLRARSKLLEQERYSTILASTGAQALDIIKKTDIDLVITDFMMPDMNGVALIERIKAYNPRIPCLLVSGWIWNSEDELPVESADGFIEKGATKEKFLDKVTQFLPSANKMAV